MNKTYFGFMHNTRMRSACIGGGFSRIPEKVLQVVIVSAENSTQALDRLALFESACKNIDLVAANEGVEEHVLRLDQVRRDHRFCCPINAVAQQSVIDTINLRSKGTLGAAAKAANWHQPYVLDIESLNFEQQEIDDINRFHFSYMMGV